MDPQINQSRPSSSSALSHPELGPISQMEPWFDDKEAQAVSDYMNAGGWITEFKKTQEFESRLSEYTGIEHCFAVNNGTVALSVALMACDIGPGDEVIVPNLTMIATPNSARMLGAVPVLVDIDSSTLCLNIDRAIEAVTPKTKAIIHVSLNGRSNDLERLAAFCRERKIFLIEDAAQSLGSTHQGRHLGGFGDLATLSFSAPKVISTGQGGAVLTSNKDLAHRVSRLKDFGRSGGGNDFHDELGYNFKFTDLQAVVGIEQMKKLPWRVERKKTIWNRYVSGLTGVGDLEWISTSAEVSPWFIDVFTDRRDELQAFLKERKIGSRPIYPSIHSQKIYQHVTGSFPVSDRYTTRGLWLPSSSRLSDQEIDWVIESVKDFFRGNA